ncbi:MAG: putative S-layer protein [archaeon]
MKKNLMFVLALFLVSLMPAALAALQVTAQDITASHNSLITIPFQLDNTGGLVSNLAINITSITGTQIISVTIPAVSKQSINASATNTYTIDPYQITQYLAAGTYPVTITVSGNESGASVSVAKTINIIVNETKALTQISGGISISAVQGATPSNTFVIQNTGNKNLTNIAFVQQSVMNDSNNNVITLSLSSSASLSLLQPGQTATITVAATVPSNEDFKAYNTNIIVTSLEGASITVPYTITITQSLCDQGRKGSYFEVDITNPDSGDDFYPNDIITLEVKVRNNNEDSRDVIVTANLFDVTDNEFLDQEVETDGTVDSDRSEYFSVDLKVPVDIKTHTFRLYAKAYEDGEEETQCNEDYMSIDIKKDTHAIAISRVSLPEAVQCDDSFSADLSLANIGKNDEDVRVVISNTELGIKEEQTLSIDKEDTKKVPITLKVPKTASEGNHTLKIQAFYRLSNDVYQDSVTRTDQINVEGNCIKEEPNLVMTTELVNDAYINEPLTMKMNLFNTGSKAATYTITVSGYEGWARLDKIDPIVLTIEPSQQASAYVYMTALALAGSKSFKVQARYADKKVEKDVNLELKEKASAPKAYQGFVAKLSNLTGFDLITVNIILVVAIILVLMWIMRVRRTY